jgi:polysaccharide pyruvyl transferase WcaK-like protein
MMNKKILHAHNFGHKNIGDDAMAENVYRKLSSIPGSEVTTISTYAPPCEGGNDVRSLSGIVNNYGNILIKIFLVGTHRLKLTMLYLAYSWLCCEFCLLVAKIYKSTGLMLLPFGASKKLIKSISISDVYVRSGSGSLNDIWFWSSMYPQYTEARLCKLFDVKVYFTGQGIGPLTTPYRLKVLGIFVDCCTVITYRDITGSEQLIRSVAGELKQHQIVGDDAFDYPKEPLNSDVDKIFDDGKKVLVCQFRPTNYEADLSEKYWRDVAKVLKDFVESDPSHEVVLVSFSNGRVSDLAVSKKLNKYADNSLIVLDQVFTAGQAKTLISKAYAAVGQSYHFGVFALSENVPFLALYTNKYYEDKHVGLLGWYQMERYAVSQDDVDSLDKTLADIGREQLALRETLRHSNVAIVENINKIFSTISS